MGVQRAQVTKANGGDAVISEPAPNGSDLTADKSKKVTFTERVDSIASTPSVSHGNSTGRQLAPGLLLMNQGNKSRNLLRRFENIFYLDSI